MALKDTIRRVRKLPFRLRRKKKRRDLLRPGVRLKEVVKLGRLREQRPYEGAFILRRKRRVRPLTAQEELEKRAVPLEKVRGSILERVVYKELQRRRLEFDFQSGLLGGRFELGGKVADFIVRWTDTSVIIRIQSFAFHTKFIDTVEDQEEKAELEALRDPATGLPFTVFDLWEDVIRDRSRLEDWLDRHLPPHLADAGRGRFADIGVGVEDVPNREEWERFLVDWAAHKAEFDSLAAAWTNLNAMGASGEIMPLSVGVAAGQLVYGNHLIVDPRPNIGHFNLIEDASDWAEAQEPAPSATNPFIIHFLGIFQETVTPRDFVVLQGENQLQSIIQIPDSPSTIDTRSTTSVLTADHQETYDSYWGLDGTGDFLESPDHADFDISGDITIGGWFYFGATGARVDMFNKNDAGVGWTYQLYKESGDDIRFSISVDGAALNVVDTVGTITINTWHYCIGRFDAGTEQSVFLDAEAVDDTSSIPASINTGAGTLKVGTRGGGDGMLTGRVAGLFITADLLTDQEIIDIRTATNGDRNNAAAYWATLTSHDVRGFWISPILNMLEDNGRALTLNGDASATTTSTDWSSRTETASGYISVSDDAGLNSTSQGLQCWVASASDTAYVSRTGLSDLRQTRLIFYFDPNTMTMATNDRFLLIQALDGSDTVFTAEIQDDGTNYEVRVTRYTDVAATASTSFYDLSDASNTIRIDWESSPADGSNAGKLALFIGGTLQEELLGIDNDLLEIDSLRVGFVSGVDAGTEEGVIYIDELTFDSFAGRRYEAAVDFNGVSNTGLFDCTIDANDITDNTNMITCIIARGSCDNIIVDDIHLQVANSGTGGSARIVDNNTNASGLIRWGT